MHAVPFPADPADERERALIGAQLGRAPRGDVAVVVRCEYGLPAVIRTAPRLPDGTPFPTLYWLVCPVAVRAASRLESRGRMREYEARLASDPALAQAYRQAHRSYVERRASLEPEAGPPMDPEVSAGGMPSRVKCLHALVAHDYAESNPIGAIARTQMEPLNCPGFCAREREGRIERVEGHPGYGGR